MTVKDVGGLFGAAANKFIADKALRHAAALAYYTVISLAPLLLVVVGVLGQVLGRATVQAEILRQVRETIGADAADLVETAIEAASAGNSGLIATVVGLFVLFIGATTVFANLHGSLNDLWGVEPEPHNRGVLHDIRIFFVERIFTFAALIGIGFLLLVSLGVSAAIETAAAFFAGQLPIPPGALRLLNLALSLGVFTALFAYIYRAIPDVQLAWRDVLAGGFVTALLFTVGKFLIGLYLGRSSIGSAYGAAGALVVLLVWIYYSATIFFFGAEFTQAFIRSHGERFDPKKGFRIVGSGPSPGEPRQTGPAAAREEQSP